MIFFPKSHGSSLAEQELQLGPLDATEMPNYQARSIAQHP